MGPADGLSGVGPAVWGGPCSERVGWGGVGWGGVGWGGIGRSQLGVQGPEMRFGSWVPNSLPSKESVSAAFSFCISTGVPQNPIYLPFPLWAPWICSVYINIGISGDEVA